MSAQNTNMNNPRTPDRGIEQNPKASALRAHPVGANVGAVVGGLAGSAAAEIINPTIEARFWQESHSAKPYALTAFGYDEFSPAYRYGWESFSRHGKESQTFESVEVALARGWDKARGASRLGWDQARLATRDAWNRVELASRGPTMPVAL